MDKGRHSLAEGYFVSFALHGQQLIADNIHLDHIQKVVPSASGGYTLLLRSGEALVSDSQVQLKVLKPFLQAEVCMCVYVCVCVWVCVCDCACSGMCACDIHTYIHKYITYITTLLHTHTHIHIHTRMYARTHVML